MKTKKKDNFEMPKWMKCTWQRIPCGKYNCPICGRIKRDRQRHIEKGEDPDDIRSVFEDVGNNFKEVLEMIKSDAAEKGFDITNIEDIKEPPEPEEFSLYLRVKEFWREVSNIVNLAENLGELWVLTETSEDLTWYSTILMSKTYRQLCNRWHIKEKDGYGEFDYGYTQGILEECFRILKEAIKELCSYDSSQKFVLRLIHDKLLNLEKEVLQI